jgi:hypothetical protein
MKSRQEKRRLERALNALSPKIQVMGLGHVAVMKRKSTPAYVKLWKHFRIGRQAGLGFNDAWVFAWRWVKVGRIT